MTRRLVNALFALLVLGSTPLLAEIVVTTTAELEAALTPANAGKRILVRAGEYVVSQALTVPDDAALVGEGEMNFDGSGLPTGFEPAGRTVIRSTAALVGDVLTLGDGSSLRGLVIEDVEGRTGGNLVAAYSRAAGDFISAAVTECEIINPNPAGIVPAGPTGAGLVALTRNLNFGADPPAHEGAVVRVEMRRSIVRCPGGGTGVFAINFAAHGEIGLVLQRNLIGGQLILNGGVSRPDAVTGASIRVESQRNSMRIRVVSPTPSAGTFSGVQGLLPFRRRPRLRIGSRCPRTTTRFEDSTSALPLPRANGSFRRGAELLEPPRAESSWLAGAVGGRGPDALRSPLIRRRRFAR